MKKYIVISMILVVCSMQSQNTTVKFVPDYERVYVEAGYVKPIGKLADKFDLSPSFGFWFRNRILKQDYIDFGFNFFIPNNPREIDFKYRDSILKYKSEHFAINIGTRFAKVIPMSADSNDFNVEWNSGIGLALNIYKAPEEINFEGDEHSGEILTTFYLSQGIKLNYKNMGLQCHYQWSPYGVFTDKMEKHFGSESLMFGLVYRQ